MKKLIYILLLILLSLTAIAQETPPTGLKAVNAQFYIHLPDSAIWQNKGAPYGWHKVGRYRDLFNYLNKVGDLVTLENLTTGLGLRYTYNPVNSSNTLFKPTEILFKNNDDLATQKYGYGYQQIVNSAGDVVYNLQNTGGVIGIDGHLDHLGVNEFEQDPVSDKMPLRLKDTGLYITPGYFNSHSNFIRNQTNQGFDSAQSAGINITAGIILNGETDKLTMGNSSINLQNTDDTTTFNQLVNKSGYKRGASALNLFQTQVDQDTVNHTGILPVQYHQQVISRYQASQSNDITTVHDLPGGAIGLGAIKDTTLNKLKNLYDIPNKTTARLNMGVYSTTQVDAFISSNYAAIGLKQPRILGTIPTQTLTRPLGTDSVSKAFGKVIAREDSITTVNNDVLTSLQTTNSALITANQATFSDGSGVTYWKAGTSYPQSFAYDTYLSMHAYPSNYSSANIIALANKFISAKDGAGNFPIYLTGAGVAGFYSGYDTNLYQVTEDGAWAIPGMYLLYYQKSGDISHFNTHGAELKTALDNIPLDGNGMVTVSATAGQQHMPVGFQDGVKFTGANLWGSLLYYEACTKMSILYTANGQGSLATTMTTRASTIASNITSALWDSTDGMFYSSGGNNRQIDVIGSALAVYLGVASPSQTTAISSYLATNYATLTTKGYIRQSPTNWAFSWAGASTLHAAGNYDNGYWSVGNEWITYALYQNSPALAYKYIAEFQANTDKSQEYYGTTVNGSGNNLESPAGSLAFVSLSGLYPTSTAIARTVTTTTVDGSPAIFQGNTLRAGTATWSPSGRRLALAPAFTTIDLPVTTDQVTNYQRLAVGQTSAGYFLSSLNGGTQSALPMNMTVNGANIQIQNVAVTGNVPSVYITRSGGHLITGGVGGSLTSSSATQIGWDVATTINQTSTAHNYASRVDPYVISNPNPDTSYPFGIGTNSAADGQGTFTKFWTINYNGVQNWANSATPGTNVANNVWMSGGYPKMEDGTRVLKFALNDNATPLTANGLVGTDANAFLKIITDLPGGTTATTQAAGDNTTKVATDALVFAERSNTFSFTNKTLDRIRLITGANTGIGSATLVAGTVTVSNTSVTASSIILLTRPVAGGTTGTLTYTISAGTSFTVTSSSATDTSTIGYVIIN